MINKKRIVGLFQEYCLKCDGACCKTAEFTVFNQELKKLPKGNYPLIFRKQWGRNGKSENIKIERISMGKNCPYLENKGCFIEFENRPLDCISYPVYPMIKYSKTESKEIFGMMTHRSCPFAKEISSNKKLIRTMFEFWKQELPKISKLDMRHWFGNKRNYWLDKNIIKTKI